MEFILGKSLKKDSSMEKVLCFISMDDLMREILKEISRKEKAMSTILMEPNTQEILLRDISMEEESMNGQMERSMMVNGKLERNMEVGCGRVKMEILILDSGKKEKSRDLVYLYRRVEIVLKGNSKIQ